MTSLSIARAENFLKLNGSTTQAMILGRSLFSKFVTMSSTSVTLRSLEFYKTSARRKNLTCILRKHFERRMGKYLCCNVFKRLVPIDTLVRLYKAYELPHPEYCSPLTLEIIRKLNSKPGGCKSFCSLNFV